LNRDKAKELLWSLYHTKAGTRVDGLTSKQVIGLLVSFSKEQRGEWLLWQEGTPEWIAAETLYSELVSKSSARQSHKQRPEDEYERTEIETESESNRRSVSRPGDIELRLRPRFRVVMRVIVTGGGHTVRSEIADISLGGMRLQSHLPPEMNGIVSVTLINKGAELPLKCHVLRNQNEQAATRLKIDSCSRMDILRQWILTEAV
jgi:hypothetical protein